MPFLALRVDANFAGASKPRDMIRSITHKPPYILGSHTFDSYNAMIDLFGPPPLLVNGTILTLEHVMQRLEIIENKVSTIELIENLDKKIHNQITQYGSKVGVTLNFFKERNL